MINNTAPTADRSGHPPPGGLLLATLDEWLLYFCKDTGQGWVSLKLISIAPHPKKNNYWLAYLKGKRLGNTRDKQILEKFYPPLLEDIQKELLNLDFCGWPV